MIVADVNAHSLADMKSIIDGRRHQLQALHGVSGRVPVDATARSSSALQRAGELGGLIQMHAENGSVIDVLVQQALAAGHTAPVYHALTRPSIAEGEATHRAIALAEIAGRRSTSCT